MKEEQRKLKLRWFLYVPLAALVWFWAFYFMPLLGNFVESGGEFILPPMSLQRFLSTIGIVAFPMVYPAVRRFFDNYETWGTFLFIFFIFPVMKVLLALFISGFIGPFVLVFTAFRDWKTFRENRKQYLRFNKTTKGAM